MNNKMAINPYISTIESKKQSKEEHRQHHGCGKGFDGCRVKVVWENG